jgi:sec-independent protein translocase protein TatC
LLNSYHRSVFVETGDPVDHLDEPKPIGAHFEELRRAILYPLIVWGVAMVLGLIFQNQVIWAIMYPMLKGVEKAKALRPDKFQFGIEKLTPQPERRIWPAPDGSSYVLRQDIVSKVTTKSEPAWDYRFKSPVLAFAVSPDGQRVAASSLDGQIAIIDTGSGKAGSVKDVPGAADLHFSPDGSSLLIARTNGEVLSLGREGGDPRQILAAHDVSFPRLLAMTHEPMEVVMVIMKAALVLGLIPGLPCLVFFLWRFVKPGLRRREPQIVRNLLLFMMLLFVVGAAFAYFVVLPVIAMFLYLLSADVAMPIWNITKVVDLTLMLVLAFGLIFQLPLVLIFLTYLGVVRPDDLARHRRIVWLAVFIVSAVLTPPDPFSQTLMAVPTILLYELGIWLSRFLLAGRGKGKVISDK